MGMNLAMKSVRDAQTLLGVDDTHLRGRNPEE
jgi:hypothetical protein